jgi:arylsulfatase A-like enzyme
VPFIVSWPSKIKAGSRSNEVVSQVDLAATFAKITGYKLTNDVAIDSYNILPVMKGEEYSSPLRKATVQNTNKGKYALRQGDWVLIDANTGAGQSEPEAYLKRFGLKKYPKDTPGLLFNLKDDPRQSKNLSQKYPEKVTSMRALLNRYTGGERCAPERN